VVDIVIASDAVLGTKFVLVLEYSFEVLVLVLVLEHTVLVAMWIFFLQICAL